jgi:4-hydroxybenzoyl-CoA reductase subunit beta
MSMLLPPFELHEPTTVTEAVRLKAEHPQSDWVAGGTDLLPNYKWGLNAKPHVISLARVEELRALSPRRIGAMVRLIDLQRDGAMIEKVPVLPATAGLVASHLLRGMGTIGGNLLLDNRCFFYNQSYNWRHSIDFCLKADGDRCHVVPQKTTCYATFSADLPAPLIALGAEFELVSAKGSRRVPAADFYTGDGIERHVLKPDEMLAWAHLPEDAPAWRAAYQKMRTRDAWDFPELGIAAAVRFEEDKIAGLRLVANALETVPKVLDGLGEDLIGKDLTDETIRALAKEVEANVRPVRNTSLLPSYRKKMVRVYTERVLKQVRDGTPPRRFDFGHDGRNGPQGPPG